MAIYYVDLNAAASGSGNTPSDPMDFNDFILALSNSLYLSSTFKLQGTQEIVGVINFENFNTLEQWNVGEPWRIKADVIQIAKNKNISGGILFASTDADGDFIYDDGVNFYSSYIICNNFKSVGSFISSTRCFLYGCTVQIAVELDFPAIFSQIVSFNSVIKIASVTVEQGEIILRNSVTNLLSSDFLTAIKERSDNNTNQFNWVAPGIFPNWDTCTEGSFDFSGIAIEAGGSPYTGYEYGLFGTARTGLGATGKLNAPAYIDFQLNKQADAVSGPSPLFIAFSPIINSKLLISQVIWDFGDGVKSNQLKPTHSYQHGGNFTPGLEVVFENGIRYKKFKKDFISVYKVRIISSENSGIAPFVVKFSVEASLPYGVSIESYDWDFGDGTPHSTDENPVHLYTTTKKYNVKLENNFLHS